MDFLTQILQAAVVERVKEIPMEIIQTAFTSTISKAGKPKSRVKRNFDEALTTQDTFFKSILDFLKRMGIKGTKSDGGILFLNGKLLEYNEAKVKYHIFLYELNYHI